MLTLLYNAQTRTMWSGMPRADAVIVDGDRFAFVGTEAAARAWLGTRPYDAVDAGGRTLIPGLNDSHMHYLHTALMSRRVLLGDARSVEALQTLLRAGLGGDTWLVADGWNQERFSDRRMPTRDDLDAVSRDVPILATRVCGHIATANSRALAIAGVNDCPDGILREDEITRVSRHIPAAGLDETLRAMKDAQHALLARGITSVQSDDVGDMADDDRAALLRGIRDMCDTGTLRLRYASQARMNTPDELTRFCARELHTLRGDGFRVSCIKLMADGSLGARTAYMAAPYADAPDTRGIAMYAQADLDAFVRIATENGIPTAIHAIGDGAMEQVLDAFEAGGGGLRHAVVHAQISTAEQVARCGAMGALILAQPVFLDADVPIVRARVGDALADTSYRWRTMLSLGARVAFGTDCPVEGFDPMRGLYCAMTRKRLEGGAAYLPDEAFTLDEALYAYTAAGAYASGEKGEKGMIRPGMLADFVVLDGCVEDGEPDALLNMAVWRTYVGGACVYPTA